MLLDGSVILSRYMAVKFVTGAKMDTVFDKFRQSSRNFKNFNEINSVPLKNEDRGSHSLLSGVIS